MRIRRVGREVVSESKNPLQPSEDSASSNRPLLLRWCIYLAAFSSSWTAVSLAGFNLVDYALGSTSVLLTATAFLQKRKLRIAPWMLFPLFAAFAISVVTTIARNVDFDSLMLLRIFLTTTCVAVVVFTSVEWFGAKFLRSILIFWVLGVTVNCLAAVGVSYGLVSFGGLLTQSTGARLSGLASHPNSLAFSATMALASSVFLVFNARFKIAWAGCLAIILWGATLSESRSFLIVGVPVLILAVTIAIRRSALRIMAVPLAIVVAVVALFVVPVAFENSRLADGAGALSDAGRSFLNENALNTFLASPVFGAGFAHQAGVSVPLTVLTAGGLVFALGYYSFIVYPLPGISRAWKTPLAPYGILSLVALTGFGFLNPVFMERVTYWPILIAFVLALAERESSPAATVSPATAARRFATGDV